MKRGFLTILLFFLIGSAWFASSWNTYRASEPHPTTETIRPMIHFGRNRFALSLKTRPWIEAGLLSDSITITPEPTSIEVTYSHKGATTWQSIVENKTNLPLPEQDGITEVKLTLLYPAQDTPMESRFIVAPRRDVQFHVNRTSFAPGELLLIRAEYLEVGQTLAASGEWFDSEPQWFVQDGTGMLLYPIPSSTKAGDYQLTLTAQNEKSMTFPITITPRNFVMQPLIVDPEVNKATRNDNSYAEFHEMLVASRNITEPMPLFDSAFVLPLDGRRTTEYGQGRTINGVPSGSRHSGYDLAAPTGTELIATQTGKVRFAGELIMTGNTIVLEHGLGIFSQYYHMDSLAVDEGDFVEADDILGTVGTTGFSTGPHLHFCIYVNGAYVDPAVFLTEGPLDFLQILPQS
jgi:murein DD-endopeptidase MepM/ murein hydrolase activator NlpD